MANILYFLIFSVFTSYHPLHLSVTEIEHDPDDKRLEIVMRIFIDDLELSVRNEVREPYMDITEPGESFSTDDLLKNYLQNKFKIKINGKEQQVEFIGHEVELPVMYIYAQVSKVKKLKEISVYNSIIMETYNDQSNLVHVKVNDELKSLKLTEKRNEDKLIF